jgi:ABC-type polysaccharide/polyol phosphate transport system ATPase subunit
MIGIELKNVGLDFPIVGLETRSIRWSLANSLVGGRLGKGRKGVISRALNNVTTSVGQGDRIGLIGANGSGKSTLLRTMAGIYSPTRGQVTREGRMVTMFEISAGMDDELTGLQNIRNRLYFLGLRDKVSEEIINEVAEFAAIGDYIHLPIKTYSMGMRMRLSFAASTLIEPEILLVDEVFAVGDRDFYDRAQARITNLLQKAGLLVMASHSDSLLTEFCSRGWVMASGSLAFDGPIADALDFYHTQVARSQEASVIVDTDA